MQCAIVVRSRIVRWSPLSMLRTAQVAMMTDTLIAINDKFGRNDLLMRLIA
jgi:hypothetical protein